MSITRTILTAAILFGSTLLTSGCSNISRLDIPQENGTPSVQSIVNRIRCELGQLIEPAYPNNSVIINGDFLVALQLSLTVNDDGSLAPSFLYTKNPIFSFNTGLKFDASREQNFTEKLIFSFKQMRDERLKFAQHHLPDPYACNGPDDTWLAGELGLKTSADIALRTTNVNYNTKLSGADGAFGGSVTFGITKNLNAVGPTWTLAHFKGPGSLAGVSEVNTDKLSFAFAQSSASGANPKSPPTAGAEVLLNQIITDNISTQLRIIHSDIQ